MKKSKLSVAVSAAKTSRNKFILCISKVKKDAVKRTAIDGIEHIIVSAYTLPFDIVMNGIMYPEKEIRDSYESLNRVLAPAEHPTDKDGNFISASDPYAIHNFYFGAYVDNVRLEGNRVAHDFVINVQEAMKTDRGKRVLDRIIELETAENPRPVHTSVGVFLEIEKLDPPMTNNDGQEYAMVGKNFVWDHNAILLDSVGAATPSQGVGIAVNMDGIEMEVEVAVVPDMAPDTQPAPSIRTIIEQLEYDIKNQTGVDDVEHIDIVGDMVVFESKQGWYQVPFIIDTNSNTARISGLPIRVERQVLYTPKTNSKEGDAMKDMIVNALTEAGVKTEGLTDEQLLAAYNDLHANQSENDNDSTDNQSQLAAIVANAIAPLSEKIGELEGKIKQTESAKIDEMVTVIVNSGRYPGLDAESIRLLKEDKIKEMAANCKPSFGLPLTANTTDTVDLYSVPTDMPA